MKKLKITLFSILISGLIYSQNKSFEVEIIGKGKPVLLFPGFSCTGKVWDNLVTQLAKTNQCHIFTFAGFGNVPAIEKPWLPKIKKDMMTYILEEKLTETILIGHSLGGTLSLWLGTEKRLNLKKIIVIDALPSTGALMMPNFNPETILYDNPHNKQLLEMSTKNFEIMASQMASNMVINEEKKEVIKNWIINTDRETYVYGYTDLLKLDLREDVAKIKTLVTILAATQPYGLETVKKTYTNQYKNLKNYKIKFAEKSAHFIMFDQPKWFIETIKNELNDE